MNAFELYTLMYYVLDAEWEEDKSNETLIKILGDLCPFTWRAICSADMVYYADFKKSFDAKTMGGDMGYEFAKEYLKNLPELSYLPEYILGYEIFSKISLEDWIEGAKQYLSEPHKGAEDVVLRDPPDLAP